MGNLIPRLEFSVQSLFHRQRRCPYCGGLNHSVAARKYGVIRIRLCKDCCLYFTDPVYRSRLGDFYNSLYQAEGLTTALPDTSMLKQLMASRFSCSDKDATAAIAALTRITRGRQLLEIGSSWGYFLFQARVHGFVAVGVEPSRMRREFGVRRLGVDIRESLDQLKDASFDIIYCAHTLEHISNISTFFPDCYRRLRQGGVLAVEVPHFDLALCGNKVLSIIGAVHPLGLSQPFFKRVLPREGFELLGFYDRWASVLSTPFSQSSEGVLIVVATKTRADILPAHPV